MFICLTLCFVYCVSSALDMTQPNTGVMGWLDSAMSSNLLNISLSLSGDHEIYLSEDAAFHWVEIQVHVGAV